MKNFKKGAADLIAIVVSVVIVAALAIGVLTFLSSKTRTTAQTEIEATMTAITNAASTNRTEMSA